MPGQTIKLETPFAVKALVEAEPEAVEIDLARTAILVIDMQNAFVANGGMFDLRGFDITPSQKLINPLSGILDRARDKGIKVIYIAHVLSPDLREVGPDSSFWYKSVRMFRESPEWREKFIIRDTWGAQIVDQLKPREDEIVIEKIRFSGFHGTKLDAVLKTHNIKNLFFAGCATNVCVEDTLRDASKLGYFPFLLSDATVNNGPAYMQDATIFNVKLCYGWVTTSDKLLEAPQLPR